MILNTQEMFPGGRVGGFQGGGGSGGGEFVASSFVIKV